MRALCFQCSAAQFVVCRALAALWPGVYSSPIAPTRPREIRLLDDLPPGWARVRVHQCGLCASDLHLMRLDLSPRAAPAALLGDAGQPAILGHELVGTVAAVGPGAALRPGQRVISRSGGFRNCFNLAATPTPDVCTYCRAGEYALCERQGDAAPAHEPIRGGGFAPVYCDHSANLLPVPDGLSDDAALLAEPMASALRAALRTLAALAADGAATPRVLVIGGGMQGLASVHWLRALRCDVHVTCLVRYAHQAELAAALGAGDVVRLDDPIKAFSARLGTRVARGPLGDGVLLRGFDAVVDSLGLPRTLHGALRWTRPGGQVMVLGAHLRPGRLDYTPIWFRDVQVRGAYAHGVERFEGRSVATLALSLELLAGRAALPANLVSHHLPLRDYRRAVALMDRKSAARAVRVALIPE